MIINLPIQNLLTQDLTTQDFDYELPENLIAQYPLKNRTDSRLLIINKNNKNISDGLFPDVLNLIQPEDLLIFNETKVLKARLFGKKASGGKVELLIERVLKDQEGEFSEALAHIKTSKALRPGAFIYLLEDIGLEVLAKKDSLFHIKIINNVKQIKNFYQLLEQQGHVPLPPYMNREDQLEDQNRYQTVFAKTEGSVAAPTAGLHFDLNLINALENKGVAMDHVILHVGAGTFQPVRVDKISEHVMHQEYFEVPESVVLNIQKARARGGKVIAVGTTSVRALESAALNLDLNGELKPGSGETQIFITPGFEFKVIDSLITNFHLPKSTLLMLVSALASRELILKAYAHAVEQEYRFFSYGDAMWISG